MCNANKETWYQQIAHIFWKPYKVVTDVSLSEYTVMSNLIHIALTATKYGEPEQKTSSKISY